MTPNRGVLSVTEAEAARALCEALAAYLNLRIDGYDYADLLPLWPQRAARGRRSVREDIEDLTKQQLQDFEAWLLGAGSSHRLRRMAYDPLAVPAYEYFEEASVLAPTPWLVHVSGQWFREFDRGTTLETLALSTHVRSKTKASCPGNLSEGLFEAVWGFAILASEAANPRVLNALVESYGGRGRDTVHAVLFQSAAAVRAYHNTDMQWQVIFPICADFDAIAAVTDGDTWYADDEEGDEQSFDSLEELIEAAEGGTLYPNAVPLRRLR